MTLEDLLETAEDKDISIFINPIDEIENYLYKVTQNMNFPAFGVIDTDIYSIYKIDDIYIYKKIGMYEVGTSTGRVLKDFNDCLKAYLKK